MELYFDREQREKILTTPFVRSWIGLARPGDLGDSDFDQRAAVGFLQAHDSAEEAWKAPVDWAGHNRTLTVSRETFLNAFRNAKLAVRRAEEPERDDINLILPLAWDEKGRVVRATFSRGSAGEEG